MLLAHLTLLAIWLCLWLVFFGWGTLACWLARCQRDDPVALAVVPWIGVGMVVALLQFWHLCWPVGRWAFLVVSIVGIGSALLLGHSSLAKIPAMVRANPWTFFVGLILVVWLVNRSLSTQVYTDHGLYYLNAIRWNSDYAIVPGLANLHNRLGFNNSNFLLHAMLEIGTWRGYTAHIVNGLFASMVIPIVVSGVRDILYDRGRARQLGWFTVGLGMIVAVSAVDRRISSAHPDLPAGLLLTVAAWRFLAVTLLETESAGRRQMWNLLSIAVLATTAISLKTTVVFFASLAGLAVVLCLYLSQRMRVSQPVWSTAKLLAFMTPWTLVIFVPWAARGYVLSGYPMFPATIGGAPVEWAYPRRLAETLRNDIYAWNRTYHKNVEQGYQAGWGWLRPWIVQVILLRAPVEVATAAALIVASLAWIAWSRRRSRYDTETLSGNDLSAWLLAMCYVGSLAAWFLTAPSPRMATFAWWGLAGTLIGLASRSVPQFLFDRHRKLILTGLLTLFLLPMAEQAALIEIRYRTNPKLPEFGQHFYDFCPFVIPKGPAGFPPRPTGKLEELSTDSGFKLYVGVPDTEGTPSLVWDSPLPTARYFNPHLKLRQPGDLQSGFMMVEPQTGGSWPPRRP